VRNVANFDILDFSDSTKARGKRDAWMAPTRNPPSASGSDDEPVDGILPVDDDDLPSTVDADDVSWGLLASTIDPGSLSSPGVRPEASRVDAVVDDDDDDDDASTLSSLSTLSSDDEDENEGENEAAVARLRHRRRQMRALEAARRMRAARACKMPAKRD